MALLVIVDDGLSTGETVRLTEKHTTIGRQDANVVIPHDGLISREHAAIVRRVVDSEFRWFLEDRESSNGTFVRVAKTRLRHDQEFLVGSKRFRYLKGAEETSTESFDEKAVQAATVMWQTISKDQLESATPRLVEQQADGGAGQVIVFNQQSIVIGSGSKVANRIDDPYLDEEHAVVSRTTRGHWVITDESSHNGLWIKIKRIELTSRCEFQIGEQRFLFQPMQGA
jgi:pSer/pThr/pTyr-binding forkhead associated (FHA) protein